MITLPLSTREKEELRDRIDELKSKLKTYSDTLIFFIAIIIPLLIFLVSDLRQQKIQLFFFLQLGIIAVGLIIFYLVIIYVGSKQKKIGILLKRNYDILLGRETKK